MILHCWLRMRRHRWGRVPDVLQAPSRYALLFTCDNCTASRVTRSVQGIATEDVARLGFERFVARAEGKRDA